MDALPPQPPPSAYVAAPGDIYPKGSREEQLCDEAGRIDWLYLGGLLLLDAGGIWAGSSFAIKYSSSVPIRLTGPVMIGLPWGATVGGAWMAAPKCTKHWVGESPAEGNVRANWPLALSLAALAAVTAPIVNGIAIGNCSPPYCQGGLPADWTTFEREMHIVAAGVAGFGGALLPYLLPPRTWIAARELDHLRVGTDGRGNFFAGYTTSF